MEMPSEYKKCLFCDSNMVIKDMYGDKNGFCPKGCMESEFYIDEMLLYLYIFVESPLLTAHFDDCYESIGGLSGEKACFFFIMRTNKNYIDYDYSYLRSILHLEKQFEKAMEMIREKRKRTNL